MSIPSTFSQIRQAFGFHTESTLTVKIRMTHLHLLDAAELNRFNGITWIPAIGNILGALSVHTFMGINKLEQNRVYKPFVVTQIIRGIATTIGLGVLLLVIDLIASLGRVIAFKCGMHSLPRPLADDPLPEM